MMYKLKIGALAMLTILATQADAQKSKKKKQKEQETAEIPVQVGMVNQEGVRDTKTYAPPILVQEQKVYDVNPYSRDDFDKAGKYKLVTYKTTNKNNYNVYYYGIEDKTGKEILPVTFSKIKELSNGEVLVKLGVAAALYTADFKQKLPFQYTNILPVGNKGLYIAEPLGYNYYDENKMLIDGSGKRLLDAGYNITIPNSINPGYSYDDYSAVNYLQVNDKSQRRYGVYDIAAARVIIPIQYSEMEEAGKMALLVKNNAGYNVIKDFKPMFKNAYDEIKYLSSADVLVVKNNNKTGIANTSGEWLAPMVYQSLDYIEGTTPLFIAQKTGSFKKGVITAKNKDIFPFVYDGITALSSSYLALKKGKWGISDILGTEWLPTQYDTIYKDDYRKSIAIKDGIYTLIDMSRNTPVFSKTAFSKIEQSGYNYKVKKGNYYGMLNSDYAEILPAEYENITLLNNAYNDYAYVVKKNGLTGIVSNRGDVKIPLQYQDIIYLKYIPAFITKVNNKYGEIDLYGKELEPAIYDYIGSDENQEKTLIAVKGNTVKKISTF